MTTQPTAAALRDQATQHEADAAESFDRCDTDGFVSQWASGLNAQQARREADIVEAGGVATFGRYVLEDLDGNPVAAKLIDGRYGPCWALTDDAGDFTGKFISAHPVRESTLARKGYREGRELFVAEAKAKMHGHGTGLASAHTVHVVTAPRDPRLRYDFVEGLGDCTEGGRQEPIHGDDLPVPDDYARGDAPMPGDRW